MGHGSQAVRAYSLRRPRSKMSESASEPCDIGARRRSRCLKIAPGEAQPERGNQIQLIIQTAVGQSVLVGSRELGPYNSYISQFSYSTSVPGPYAIEIEYEWAIIFLKRPYY